MTIIPTVEFYSCLMNGGSPDLLLLYLQHTVQLLHTAPRRVPSQIYPIMNEGYDDSTM